jgi:hypothetical protein
MHIEARLRKLESNYRAALSATVVAKTNYLALAGDPSAPPAAVRRAKVRWQKLDAAKRGIASQMGEIEDFEHGLFSD